MNERPSPMPPKQPGSPQASLPKPATSSNPPRLSSKPSPPPVLDQAPPGWAAVFTHNAMLKVLALGAAIVLFSVVRSGEDAQRSVFVDLIADVPSEEDGRVLVSELPAQIRLTLQGSRSVLNDLTLDPIQINLAQADGAYYYLDASQLNVPMGISVTQISPDAFELDWDELGVRSIAVRVVLEGQVPEGLELKHPPVAVPSRVRLKGAATRLGALTQIRTEPLDLSQLGEGKSQHTLRLQPATANTRYMDDSRVRVDAELVQIREQRWIRRVEVQVVGVANPPRVKPVHVSVQLSAPPNQWNGFDPEALLAMVEPATDKTNSRQFAKVEVRGIPEGFEVQTVEPQEVLLVPQRR